jgi:hypothetical protein
MALERRHSTMQLTIDLTEEQANALHELAAFYSIEPEKLFGAAVRGLFSDRDERFGKAAKRVLEDNSELLERLS